MTDVSPGATLSPPAPDVPRADEILVAFSGPAPQRRWTVFLRLLLVIPHVIVLWALGVAAEVVLVISWFAALFTGRVPQGLADFLAGWLRWSARVYAYEALLTDQYPPFELGDAGYPVRIAVSPGPLNRLAVFFRIVLAIPAAIVGSVAVFGAAVASLVIWLIVLIGGTMPRPLHEALSAIVRYMTRFYGYSYLLTATYPGGLFGDKQPGEAPAAAPPAAFEPPAPPSEAFSAPAEPFAPPSEAFSAPAEPPAAPAEPPAAPAEPPAAAETMATPAEPPTAPAPAYGEPPAESLPYGQPGYPQAGYAQAPGYAAMAAPAPVSPEGWRLVLSGSARRLMGLFLGLGVIAWIGYAVGIGVAVSNASSTVNARLQVESAHNVLTGAVNSFQLKVRTCQQNITCVTNQDRIVASAFGTFGDSVRGTSMPNSAASAAQAQLLTDTSQVQADLTRLSHATSAASYEQILGSTNLQGAVTRFDSDYQRLTLALSGH
jgi:Domain of unknown function (DUF4389)